jgi:diguanylate cyclase (GGDEF)-like protein
VVRYGGDEFLLVLSETDEAGSKIVMNRIRQKVAEWDRANRLGDFSIGISLGLHQHVPGETAEQAVAEADARMYADKQIPRNKNAVATSPPSPHA